METKSEQIIFNSKKKEVIILLLPVLLVFIILIFFIWLCFEKIKSGSDNLFSQKTQIALLESQANETESFKRKYNDYLPNLQKIDQIFVDPQNPLKFIEFLEQSASGANINLEISPLSFSKDGDLKILSLQLISKGSFSEILGFLKKIEDGPYLLSIQNLAITSFKTSKSDDKVLVKTTQANFSIKILTQ